MESKNKPYKVLLVDMECVRTVIKESTIFEYMGFKVTGEASNHDEVFEKLDKECFDVILTGISVSEGDGFELARQIKEKYPLLKTIVINGRAVIADQFKHLKNKITIQNDHKNRELLENTILRSHILRHILNNDFKDREELRDIIEQLGIYAGEKKCIIVFRLINPWEVIEKLYNSSFNMFEEALGTFLHDQLEFDDSEFTPITVFINKNFVVMAQYYNADTVVEILNSFCDNISVEYKIGIGRPYEDIEYMKISYMEALEAIGQCKSGHNIKTYSIKNNEKDDELKHIVDVHKRIIYSMESGMFNEVSDMIDTMFADIDKYDFNNAFNLYINSIRDILGYFNIDDVEKYKIKYRFDILGITESDLYNALKATYIDNINNIIDVVKNISDDSNEQIVKKVRDIILQNYHKKDLSLCDISHSLNVSYGYLSTIFKQINEISFMNYLTSVRMANAKKLLMEGSLKVCEIADAVGYGSAGYFIDAFRKKFDVSPGDYRTHVLGKLHSLDSNIALTEEKK